MSRELYFLWIASLLLLFLLSMFIFYFSYFDANRESRIQEKYAFVAFVGLPDLAITNEPYLRHRSLSGVFSVYSADGALREQTRESFLLSKELP